MTSVTAEADGRIFSFVAHSSSRDLRVWTPPARLTKLDQTLNFSSPGNVIRAGDDWAMCVSSYPRPGYRLGDPVRYGDKTARIWLMRSKDLVTWGEPEILRVKGDVAVSEMGRMIDPYLIEDAAESLGSDYKNQHTGIKGHVSVLSFNGNKTITTGGGGMIVMRDEKLAKRAKHLTTTAKIPHAWEFYHDEVGYNYRLPNINAALGVAQMEYLPEILINKRQTAMDYKNYFKSTELKSGIKFVDEPADSKSNFWLNSILLNSRAERDQFLEYTNKNGVMTRPVWALMNEMVQFKSAQTSELTNALFLRDHLVNIPSSFRKFL